jgi:hypothetical protein
LRPAYGVAVIWAGLAASAAGTGHRKIAAGLVRAEKPVQGSGQQSCRPGRLTMMITVMCLRFAFLLITRVVAWLRLSRREEAWRITEILILRHQLAVLQRQQPCRPKLNWCNRALLGVIPKARRHGLQLLVTPDTILRGTATSSAAAGPVPLQNSPQDCDLLFGRMGWLRQDRGLCPFACST